MESIAPGTIAARTRAAAVSRCALGFALGTLAALGAAPAPGQEGPGGTVEPITVHSPSIEGNLHGNSADRDVLVYLPPSYGEDDTRRYPVVYLLHGWLPGAEQFAGMLEFEDRTNRAFASGAAREMIIVVPDAQSVLGGSMYSTSVTSGDFEGFIANDLVEEIDGRYRTLARRESRGLAGHSMGGYGTLRIAMEHPELYAGIYAMSACCLAPYEAEGPGMAQAAAVESLDEAREADIGTRVQLTLAAAWSPSPENPPLYYDFPLEDGEVRPLILAKWNANVPLVTIDQHVPSLRRLDAIALDIGTQDGLIGSNRRLSEALTAYGIEHSFETYDGDHTSRIAERYGEHVLAFFSEVLEPGR